MKLKNFIKKLFEEGNEDYQKKWFRQMVILVIIFSIVSSYIMYKDLSKMYIYNEATGIMMKIVDGVEQETNLTMKIIILLSILQGTALSLIIISCISLFILIGGLFILISDKKNEKTS